MVSIQATKIDSATCCAKVLDSKILSSACAVASDVAVEFSHADRPGLCVVTLQRRKSRGWGTGWIFRLVAGAE
jgi:hypothetical protein